MILLQGKERESEGYGVQFILHCLVQTSHVRGKESVNAQYKATMGLNITGNSYEYLLQLTQTFTGLYLALFSLSDKTVGDYHSIFSEPLLLPLLGRTELRTCSNTPHSVVNPDFNVCKLSAHYYKI